MQAQLTAEAMNSQIETMLAAMEPKRRERVERQLTAEAAWDVLKRGLADRYRFVASKIEQRVHLMWIDGDLVDFRDAATKARMWANVKTGAADLMRDARWTAEVMEDYRTDVQLADDWTVAERRTVKRLKSVRWIREHRDALVDTYKSTHSRHHGSPMGGAILALVCQMPKEDRMAIEEALARSEMADEEIAYALESVAIDEATIEQEAWFRQHEHYGRGLNMMRRWKHATDAVTRANAMVDAEDICYEINKGAWVTGSGAMDCMLRDLAAPEERLMAA